MTICIVETLYYILKKKNDQMQCNKMMRYVFVDNSYTLVDKSPIVETKEDVWQGIWANPKATI